MQCGHSGMVGRTGNLEIAGSLLTLRPERLLPHFMAFQIFAKTGMT